MRSALLLLMLLGCGSPPATPRAEQTLIEIGSAPLAVGQSSVHRLSGELSIDPDSTGKAASPRAAEHERYRAEWTEEVVEIEENLVRVRAHYDVDDRVAADTAASLRGRTFLIDLAPPHVRVRPDDGVDLDEELARDLARRHRDAAPFARARPDRPLAIGAGATGYLAPIAADLGLDSLDGEVRLIAADRSNATFTATGHELGDRPSARVACRFSVRRVDGRLTKLSCSIDGAEGDARVLAVVEEEISWR